jgi:transcriptional regulator with GAF, ATPase, and Fis domain
MEKPTAKQRGNKKEPMLYRLLIDAGTEEEREVLLDKPAYRVGRSGDADIVIPNKNISGLHFSLLLNDIIAEIIDLDSTNGTAVNGEKIRTSVLRNGDIISVGGTTIVFTKTKSAIDRGTETVFYPVPADRGSSEAEALLDSLRAKGTLVPTDAGLIADEIARCRRDSTLLEALYGLLQKTLPLTRREEILALLLEKINALLNLEIAGIYLVDEQRFFILEKGGLVSEENNSLLSASVLRHVLDSKRSVVLDHIGSEEGETGFKSLVRFNIRSCLCFPILNREGEVLGAFYCVSRKIDQLRVLENDRRFLDLCSAFIALILENIKLIETEKSRAYKTASLEEQRKFSPIISRLRQEREILSLKLGATLSEQRFFGLDDATNLDIKEFIAKAARTGLPALITGETGVGKSVVAREIHAAAHHQGPFVTIDCTTIPPDLLESELFGHERGAFTGAYAKRPGKVRAAQGGTLLIDEIGELTPGLQGKLLRFIQSGEYEPLGGTETLRSDAKLIAATNRDLNSEVAQKRFREDLYFRLNILQFELPPLRSRRALIMPLAAHFLSHYARRLNPDVRGFTESAKALMLSHAWPGNTRELENAVMRALVNTTGDTVDSEHLALERHPTTAGETGAPDPASGESLDLKLARERIDRVLIRKAMETTGRNVSQAAKLLNLSRNSLMDLLKKYVL